MEQKAEPRPRKRKTLFVTITIVYIVLVAFVTLAISGVFNFNTAQLTTSLKTITLEELSVLIKTDIGSDVYVYIGRESCPVCTAIYPSIEEVNVNYKLELQYYSTESDREIRPDEMTETLDAIGVNSVPSVVVFSGGEISAIYSGEEFVAMYPL